MTRIIRNIPRKKVHSVPTENEQKAPVVSYNNKQKRNNKNIFLWLPLSFTLAYGSVSFILLEHGLSLPVFSCWSTLAGWSTYPNWRKTVLDLLAFSFYRVSLPTSFSAFCSSVPSPLNGQI